MPKISCSVESCSYNGEHQCNAHVIQVGGKGAQSCQNTCCGTYMNRAGYSNLAQYTSNRGEVEEILCRVDTCAYYGDNHCTLSGINMGSSEKVDIYTETQCESFEKK